jgi:hypothetical protein
MRLGTPSARPVGTSPLRAEVDTQRRVRGWAAFPLLALKSYDRPSPLVRTPPLSPEGEGPPRRSQ